MGFDVGYCDLEISGRILKNDSLGYNEVPYSSVSHWSALTEPRFHHWEKHQWPVWQTGTLLLCWGTECLWVQITRLLLQVPSSPSNWIWWSAGWLQSQAFSFYSWSFSMSGWGCPLYAMTTGNWSAGVRFSVTYCFSTESQGGYNSVSNKWNDLKTAQCPYLRFGTVSWRRTHSGGTTVASVHDYRKNSHPSHSCPVGRKEGLMGEPSFCCFGKHTTKLQTSYDDFCSNV